MRSAWQLDEVASGLRGGHKAICEGTLRSEYRSVPAARHQVTFWWHFCCSPSHAGSRSLEAIFPRCHRTRFGLRESVKYCREGVTLRVSPRSREQRDRTDFKHPNTARRVRKASCRNGTSGGCYRVTAALPRATAEVR